MKSVLKIAINFIIVFIFTGYHLAFCSALKIWDTDGLSVSSAPDHQLRTNATADQLTGAILVWEDFRDENRRTDIFGQKISLSGQIVWQIDGLPLIQVNNVRGEPASHTNPSIDIDGTGGAIFTWTDNRSLQGDVYAQRISSNGEIQWQENGIPIATACWGGGLCANNKHLPQIVSDGSGGAIITWYEMRDGFHLSVWAQRVNVNGEVLWQVDGVPIAMGEFNADFPKIVSNGSGGAIISWQDGRDLTYRIFVQQIDANGIIQWPINGVEICPAIAQRGSGGHSIVEDGFGGAVITWVDGRKSDSNDADIYAQRINSNGELQWVEGGKPVCTRERHQYSPKICNDKKGGAIIVWEDQGASPMGSGEQWIYSQHISGSGQIQWTLDGMAIYKYHSHGPQITSDDIGGAIIAWNTTQIIDPFTHKPTLKAQHVTGRGRMLWSTSGFEVYSQIGNYGFDPRIISDGTGGAIVHWTDYRNTNTAWDIYSQRIISDSIISDKAMPWLPLLLAD